jgi:hypothetical protein
VNERKARLATAAALVATTAGTGGASLFDIVNQKM